MALSGTPNSPDDYDALAEARRAARRAGMSLGEWLDAVVEGRVPAPRHSTTARSATQGSTEETIAAIRARLDEFARRHARPEYDDTERRVSRDIVRRLEDRLDALTRTTRGTPADREAAPGRDAGDPLSGEVGRSSAEPRPSGSAELKEAITEIANRQRTLEREFEQAMAGYSDRMDHRIDRVAERIERRIEEASPATAVHGLEEQLRAVAARLDDGRRGPLPDLHGELTDLARRLEDLPPRVAEEMAGRLEDTARRLDTATRAEVDSIRGEMREIAQEIDRATRSGFEEVRAGIAELMARMSQTPPAAPPGEVGLGEIGRAELASLRDDIRALGTQLEGSLRRPVEAVPGEDGRAELAALRDDIRALSSQLEDSLRRPLDQPVEAAPGEDGRAELAALRDDIRALASQFEGSHRENHASLREELRQLAERIDARFPDRLQELERHLDMLVERIGREPAGLEGAELAEIERQIALLGERFEATPSWLQDVQSQLDQVAERMGGATAGTSRDELVEIERQIARLADRLDAEGGTGGDLAGIEQKIGELFRHFDDHNVPGSPAVLKDEFAALKSSVDHANERSMAALGAVHDTLNRIVDRISDLEAEVESVAAGERRTSAPREEEEGLLASGDLDAPEPVLGTDDIIGRIEAVTRSFKAYPDDHTPLAPGSGPPTAAAAQPDHTVDPTKSSRGDFIAAARRAAQAATAEASGHYQGSDDAPPRAGLLSRLEAYRRPLLIAAAIGLLIVGALKLADIMASRDSGRAPEPAAEDTLGGSEDAIDGEPVEAPEPALPAAEPATEGSLPQAPRSIGLGGPRDMAITTGSTVAPEDLEIPRFQVPAAADEAVVEADAEAEVEPAQDAAPSTLPGDLPREIGSERLRQAAADGSAAAQFEIAARYTDGRGVPQDLAKAAHWYRLAAAQGLAPAQYRLGSLYEKGHGVPRDVAMARSWYQRAAEQGNRTAMHNLAVLHAEGVDGEPDYEQAALWFRQSSEYGLKDSQYNLAILYARGLGVEASLTDSYRWFAAAAEQGDAEAAVQRDEIARRLEPEALAAAKLAVQSWQPNPMIEEANRVADPAGGWEDQVAQLPSDLSTMVRETQALLDRLGYAPGPIDGHAGAMTRRAVIEFQRAAGLPETGEITPELIDHLTREAG